jgi:hypothetical protein
MKNVTITLDDETAASARTRATGRCAAPGPT